MTFADYAVYIVYLVPSNSWDASNRPEWHEGNLLMQFLSWCSMQMFKRFHTAYVDAVSNPFYTTSTVSSLVIQPAHISGCVCVPLQNK